MVGPYGFTVLSHCPFHLSFLSYRDSEERYSETEYITSPPLGKMFPGQTVDSSSQKLYHDEAELLSDSSIIKTLTKEAEAVVESPIRKIYMEELEASVDASGRKMAKDQVLDTSLDSLSFKKPQDESSMEATSRKISRDRGEVPLNVSVRKSFPNELDAEFSARKVERDSLGELKDPTSWSVHRERSDLPMDMRKMIWNEVEAKADVAPRKISKDMMGASFDTVSRKMMREDFDYPFDSVSRRSLRDSGGMSMDTGSRKHTRNRAECQLESSVRALAMDNISETARIPSRKISREELEEYGADPASTKMLNREKFESLMETLPPAERQEYGLEPATSRRTLRDELEMSAGSLRRRLPRLIRNDSDTDIPSGKVLREKVDGPAEMQRQQMIREDFEASDLSSTSGPIAQPDLMITSQGPWQSSSSDIFPVGPLSQLVYDGILEKSCNPMATIPTGLSASTPNLPQSRLVTEEPAAAATRIAAPTPPSPKGTGEEKHKEKEKSKKSMKLKNLFKRKNDSSPEKIQSGLQKL